MTVSVVLPTYNEARNIGDLIDAIQAQAPALGSPLEIVVVDDNSMDGTADVVRARANRANSTVRLFVRTTERGLATAIRHGIEQSQGDVIVVMDTDFNHDPRMIPQMVELLKYYDLVVGSRFVRGGGMEDAGRYRLSFAYNLFVRLALRMQIQDNLSGFFAMRRDRLLALDTADIFRGYGEFFVRLLFLAGQRGDTMVEVPVFYVLRRHGDSKSRFGSMLIQYSRCVLALWLRPRTSRSA